MEFTTDRLTLRPWDPDDPTDVAAALEIYRREEVARWLGATPEPWQSLEQAHERLQRWRKVVEEHPGLGLWAINLERRSPPIGTALLVRLPDGDGELTDDIEIGWHLHPDSWGQGYATEAAGRLLEHAWTLELPEVNAVAFPDNLASLAVMRRLGMERQGCTDRWYGVAFEWWLLGAPLPPAA
ncbi:MAG TPA: GNAT family N-acetyltransferase [Actinomycetes bacterium]|nr:GNAT family N-acetyltransferase [Actinomycetes bacterium]